ncbi:MAG: ABC transporter ATP-binding protein [Comamonadaceae bacterium]|nr:ABC transporter ATP-binding protein [Comamonadaceae bacterium]
MGPSGSGKSTAMNILGCLDTPTARQPTCSAACRCERLTRDQRALLRRRYLGFVFQGFNLLARTSALENVELPLLYRGEPPPRATPAARAALGRGGPDGLGAPHAGRALRRPAAARGDRARASSRSPTVLLADEPTGNLDTQRSREIMELLAALNRERGITVLMVTHEADMAALRAAHRALRRRPWSTSRRQPRAEGAPGDAVEHAAAGAARDPAQPAALVPDHPGHRDRRRAR